MATVAKQQYLADEATLHKEARTLEIEQGVKEKIDSIEEGAQVNKLESVKVNGATLPIDDDKSVNVEVPRVINHVYSTSDVDALSANMGRELSEEIIHLKSIGRFLSLWDAEAGMPETQPPQGIYNYKTGDYFVISKVAADGGTNYKPDGVEYIAGDKSEVVETEKVHPRDWYFYDGTTWTLQINSGGGAVDVDDKLSLTSEYPVQNKVITAELNKKATDNTVVHTTGNETIAGDKTFSSDVTATGFKTSDGASTQFLKADGSVDDNEYALKSDLDKKLTKVSSTSSKVYRVYGIDAGGYQTVIDVSNSVNSGGLVRIDDSLHSLIPTPTRDTDIANKKYVDDAIEQIEQEKTPNVTVVGTPTIVAGNISNFSTNNYLIAPFLSSFSGNPFTLHMDFTTTSDVTTQQNIVDSTYGLAFAISNAKFIIALSTNGTSWNVGEFTGTYAVKPNTDYHVEIQWDGQNVTLKYSTDGTNYTQDISTALTSSLSGKTLYFGGYGATSHPFKGTFNFNERWFKSGENVVWKGMDVAGLDTRANVSLSNLDEAGVAKIQSYINDNWVSIYTQDRINLGSLSVNQDRDTEIVIPFADNYSSGLVIGGNGLSINQNTGVVEAGEYTKAQYDSVDGKTFVGKTTLDNVLNSKKYIPEGGTEGQVVTKTDSGIAWSDLPESDMQYKDFNFTSPEGIYEIPLGLSTTITPTADFTLLAPEEIKDGQVYILRCDNTNSYVMTLGDGFANPHEIDLTLTADAIDQFVFLAVGDILELQGEGGSGSATVYLTQEEYNELPDSKLTDGINYVIYGSGEGADSPVTKQELSQILPKVVESVPTAYTPDKMYFIVKSNGGTNGNSST